jgi:ParB family chromosome partitioning protein
MAQAAEQLLAGTGWLPTVLRTAQPAAEPEADAYLQAAE